MTPQPQQPQKINNIDSNKNILIPRTKISKQSYAAQEYQKRLISIN
jgi:hypothetical protein